MESIELLYCGRHRAIQVGVQLTGPNAAFKSTPLACFIAEIRASRFSIGPTAALYILVQLLLSLNPGFPIEQVVQMSQRLSPSADLPLRSLPSDP